MQMILISQDLSAAAMSRRLGQILTWDQSAGASTCHFCPPQTARNASSPGQQSRPCPVNNITHESSHTQSPSLSLPLDDPTVTHPRAPPRSILRVNPPDQASSTQNIVAYFFISCILVIVNTSLLNRAKFAPRITRNFDPS